MISWFGGKSRIGKWIGEQFPERYDTYVEPFSGAFWTYYKSNVSNTASKIVYNDINRFMVNIFMCAATDPDRLDAELEKLPEQDIPLSFEWREDMKKLDFETFPIPNYELAAKYANVQSQVFSGSDFWKGKLYDINKFRAFKKKHKVGHKTRELNSHITDFRNESFEVMFEDYDSPETLFYLDPPYFTYEKNYSVVNLFTYDDHKRLSDMVKELKGKWLLSYYANDALEEWFPRDEFVWLSKEFNKNNGNQTKSATVENKGTELLIMNYDPNEEVSGSLEGLLG